MLGTRVKGGNRVARAGESMADWVEIEVRRACGHRQRMRVQTPADYIRGVAEEERCVPCGLGGTAGAALRGTRTFWFSPRFFERDANPPPGLP